jgi:hypothetical protein
MDDVKDDGYLWVDLGDEEQTCADFGDLVPLASEDDIGSSWGIVLDYESKTRSVFFFPFKITL